MDDAHAHPQSPAQPFHARSQSIPPSLRDCRTTHSITPKSVPHTRQQILLQTRHARFSAQSLSVNGINVPFPQLTRSAENDSPYFSYPRFNKRDENGTELSRSEQLSNASSESAILNEITNINAYRTRGLKRRAAIPVFYDSPDKHSVEVNTPTPSIYHDAPSDIQPPFLPEFSREDSPSMGLREISGNVQRPSPSKASPSYRSVRGRLSRKSSQPKPSFNSDEYIEHIENELQTVKDAMCSPTTHLPWKEKLKKAKEEIHQLKKEMEALRSSFEYEMRETVERSTETELKLKRKIKDLEDEVDLKQSVIHDLECDRDEITLDQNAVDGLRIRIEKLEEEKLSLEAINRDMTKRNEVLTQLLALSPTKTQPSLEFPTPRRRSARPMSLIIPRMPSSPGVRTSQSIPQSTHASPALGASDYFPPQIPSSPLASSPDAADDRQSIDSGLGESCAPFASGQGSRRSTLASYASSDPDTQVEGHIRSESRSQTVLRHPAKRRPRKFMSGSTQLKPLLLPTFTAENGNLPSTSPFTSPTRQFPIQLSNQSSRYELASVEQDATGQYEEVAFPSPESMVGRPGPAFQSLGEVFADDKNRFQPSPLVEPLADLRFSNHISRYRTSPQNRLVETTKGAIPHIEPSPRISSWVLNTASSSPENGESDPNQANKTVTEALRQQSQDDAEFADVFARRGAPFEFGALSTLPMHDNVGIPRPLFSKTQTHNGWQSSSSHEYPETPFEPPEAAQNELKIRPARTQW